jgi:uncharacterized coiled-coil DUF342 family protein
MNKEITDKKIDNLTQIVGVLSKTMIQGFKDADKKTNDLSKTMIQGFKDAEIRTDDKIDELARITAKGFSNIGNNIATFKDETNIRFDKIDERFEKVDENFREINMKLHDRDENVRRNTTRIEKLEENAGIL